MEVGHGQMKVGHGHLEGGNGHVDKVLGQVGEGEEVSEVLHLTLNLLDVSTSRRFIVSGGCPGGRIDIQALRDESMLVFFDFGLCAYSDAWDWDGVEQIESEDEAFLIFVPASKQGSDEWSIRLVFEVADGIDQ